MANKKLLNQITKFIIVGGIATIIDLFVYYICCNFFNINPLISNIIAFSIAVIYNYSASVKWIFDVDKDKNRVKIIIEFFVFSIIGLLLTELLLYIFIDIFDMNSMLAKIIATGIVMVFNFVTRKIFLEKH